MPVVLVGVKVSKFVLLFFLVEEAKILWTKCCFIAYKIYRKEETLVNKKWCLNVIHVTVTNLTRYFML